MNQTLITNNIDTKGHWISAFSSGRSCRHPNEVLNEGSDASDIVWLDVSNIDVELRSSWLQQSLRIADKVVVLSNVPNELEALTMIKQGAVGYCHAKASITQLKEISLVISNGGVWLGPDLLQRVLTSSLPYAKLENNSSGIFDSLTDREYAVGLKVGEGANNKEIAEALDITERTVKSHLSNIFAKLAVRDRVQLALLFHQNRPH